MDEALKFHMDVLSNHNNMLFDTLIQPHNIVSDNLKIIEFDDEDQPKKGYFAKKDMKKYFIGENAFKELPIRIRTQQEHQYKEDIVYEPLDAVTFRITPKHTFETKELIDDLCPFEHSIPDQWTLAKIISVAGYVCKTFVCMASEPHFGKSSIYYVLNGLTDKSPVFKPRSIPGVLQRITTTGNMVFDEAHEAQKDTRDIMEEVTLVVAGGSPVYINGAMKAKGMKTKYDTSLQSITFLFNDVDCYKEPEKKYFEVIFSNNKAMNDRLLKVRLKGKLVQKFNRDFDIIGTAKEHRDYYIRFAKELLYLQELKQSGGYERRWDTHSVLNLKGRIADVYSEISWLIDRYATNQTEYDKFIDLLDKAIIDYKEMVSGLVNETTHIEVEKIEG